MEVREKFLKTMQIWDDWGNKHLIKEFVGFSFSHLLDLLTLIPTSHLLYRYANLINRVLTNLFHKVIHLGVIELGLFDHNLICRIQTRYSIDHDLRSETKGSRFQSGC